MSKPRKRSFWDAIGKIFKGNKEVEIPEGCDFCEMCGKIYSTDELHLIIQWLNTQTNLLICEECSERSPSTWRRNFPHEESK